MGMTYYLMANGRSARLTRARAPHQRGTVAILFAVLLLTIIGFCGLALDLGRVYNRKVEMQNVADTIALAAAAQLDGTALGISAALNAAAARMTDGAPQHLTYQYSHLSMDWADAAIAFSTKWNGPWLDGSSAKATPQQILFVRVSSADLDASYGRIDTFFIHVVDDTLKTVSTRASAIAGRSTLNAVPLAICAMRPEAALNRSGELVEYGFRRGISYDLMKLNADSSDPAAAENFLINPFARSGTVGASLNPGNLSAVKPYVCTGSLAIPSLTTDTNGQITVESPFPLSTFYAQLNSRFDTYTAPCTANSAPPDANVKVYQKAAGAWIPWMSVGPRNQSAVGYADTALNKYWTVADPSPSPDPTLDKDYGPLWQYARPVKWSAYVPGTPEPATGYIFSSLFDPSDWATLYNPGKPVKTGTYPTPTKPTDPRTPYESTSTPPPSGRKGLRNRRVLNVPLLQCPVAGNSATVLGIGKFFMTVPATATNLYVEFAGAVPSSSVGGQVELYPPENQP